MTVLFSVLPVLVLGCGGGGLKPGEEVVGETGREAGYLEDYWEGGPEAMLRRGRPLESDMYACAHEIASHGGIMVIEVVSEDFDPIAFLLDEENGSPIAWNDDWGTGTDSRIVASDVPGSAVLVVASLGDDQGEYTLVLETGDEEDLEEFRALESPEGTSWTVSGFLMSTKRDEMLMDLLEDELEHNVWSGQWQYLRARAFSLPREGLVDLRLSSDDFDPVLVLLEMEGDGVEFVAYNDDFAGMNSRIERFLPDGDYMAVVLSYGTGESGEYEISLRVNDDPESFDFDPVQAYQEGEAYFDDVEPGVQLLSGIWPAVETTWVDEAVMAQSPSAVFEFLIEEGAIFATLDASSEEVDPCLLLLQTLPDGGLEYLAFNDDHPETGRDSRIRTVLPGGSYLAAVIPYDAATGGEVCFSYSDDTADLDTLVSGSTVDIDAECQSASYILPLEIRRRYTISASSATLDSYLDVYLEDGTHLSDDDSGDDFDAELSFIAPDSSRCLVTVHPFDPGSYAAGTIRAEVSVEDVPEEELAAAGLLPPGEGAGERPE